MTGNLGRSKQQRWREWSPILVRKSTCQYKKRAMRRIEAIVLLLALLAGPVAAVSGGAVPEPDCCSGTMCPMHNQKSQSGKSSCPSDQNSPTCQLQSCDHQSDAGVPQAAPQAILSSETGLALPQETRLAKIVYFAIRIPQFISPPDQPPRA